ncbi:hypothetical protein KSP40_PGU022299 [Platanthera guangdongensis]|uniref:Tetratricopeptide repeat protein n=1 Tax=Platanthera guangdongensis TaxID=2320717 RepID=A0ABR2LRW6_9ASPA
MYFQTNAQKKFPWFLALKLPSEQKSMKIAWKTKSRVKSISSKPNLPFESSDKTEPLNHAGIDSLSSEPNSTQLSASFESQGIQLAESGRYSEALTKLESAVTLMPEKAKLHEQKAQLLLEIGDTWNALKAAKSM